MGGVQTDPLLKDGFNGHPTTKPTNNMCLSLNTKKQPDGWGSHQEVHGQNGRGCPSARAEFVEEAVVEGHPLGQRWLHQHLAQAIDRSARPPFSRGTVARVSFKGAILLAGSFL